MPIAEAAGLDAAIDYLTEVGLDAIHAHEQDLLGYALDALAAIDGPADPRPGRPRRGRGAAISFTVDGVHPHDVSQVLDEHGVAVRAGHHCAWPLHRRSASRPAPARRSTCTTRPTEVDALVDGIRQAQRFFGWLGRTGMMQAASRCTRRSSWTTTGTRTTRACGSRTTPRCTT